MRVRQLPRAANAAWSAAPGPRERDEQPARGLRVERERDEIRPRRRRARRAAPANSRLRRVAARPLTGARDLERAGRARQRFRLEDDAHAAPRRQLVRVAEQPEAGDVGDGARRERRETRRAASRFSVRIQRDRAVERVRRRRARAWAVEDEAGPERLGQEEHVARARAPPSCHTASG